MSWQCCIGTQFQPQSILWWEGLILYRKGCERVWKIHGIQNSRQFTRDAGEQQLVKYIIRNISEIASKLHIIEIFPLYGNLTYENTLYPVLRPWFTIKSTLCRHWKLWSPQCQLNSYLWFLPSNFKALLRNLITWFQKHFSVLDSSCTVVPFMYLWWLWTNLIQITYW